MSLELLRNEIIRKYPKHDSSTRYLVKTNASNHAKIIESKAFEMRTYYFQDVGVVNFRIDNSIDDIIILKYE